MGRVVGPREPWINLKGGEGDNMHKAGKGESTSGDADVGREKVGREAGSKAGSTASKAQTNFDELLACAASLVQEEEEECVDAGAQMVGVGSKGLRTAKGNDKDATEGAGSPLAGRDAAGAGGKMPSSSPPVRDLAGLMQFACAAFACAAASGGGPFNCVDVKSETVTSEAEGSRRARCAFHFLACFPDPEFRLRRSG